jgi:uncharacterized membrane protein YdjX (TVP38/TMEM64 family)
LAWWNRSIDILKIGSIVCLIVIAPVLIIHLTMPYIFSAAGISNLLSNAQDYAWIAAIGLLAADIILPLPSSSIMASMGILYGPILGGLISSIGTIVAGLIAYWISRIAGLSAMRLMGAEKTLEAGQEMFSDIGGWFVVVSRWLPIIAEVVSCVAGLSRMPFKLYFLALVAGCLPLGFTYSVLGYAGSNRPVLTVVLVAFVPIALWLLFKALSQSSNRRTKE